MISVILNAYDITRVQRHMTQQCMACIRKYTDGPYELIIIDNDPTLEFYREYETHLPEIYYEATPKLNVYEAYNLGAALASGDKLMFIQNDVFVHERTIDKLAAYLDEWDVAFPQQYPITRAEMSAVLSTPDGQKTVVGQRDAGLLAITREAFDKSGGWDDRYHNLLGEAAYYSKIDAAGLSWTDQTNAVVTHIMAANNLAKDTELYNKEMEHDASILN